MRCEYYEVLQGPRSYATMLRTRQYKLVTYHGLDWGELFDLRNEPHEFENLWDDPKHAQTRFNLMRKSFDSLALSVDLGTERVGRY